MGCPFFVAEDFEQVRRPEASIFVGGRVWAAEPTFIR